MLLPFALPAQALAGVKIVAAAAVAGALVWCGYWLGGLEPRAELAQARTDHAEQVAEWNRLAAAGAQRALTITAQWQQQAEKARGDLDDERERNAALAADIVVLRATVGGLRGDLAAYAAGTGAADTVAACRARAETLASLLAEGSELLAEGGNLLAEAARAHDDRAAEVRALIAAWPKNRAEDH